MKGILVKKAKISFVKEELYDELAVITEKYSHLIQYIEESCQETFTVEEAIKTLENLRFKNDPLQIRGYIDERIIKNDIKFFFQHIKKNSKYLN